MIEVVGVIGAGTMGNGIAQICAAAGLQVVMTDIADAAVQRGLATVGSSLERLVKKEKMSAADREPHWDASSGRRTGPSSPIATRDRGGDRERGIEAEDSEVDLSASLRLPAE